jgi:DTW domain-containing protein YfiP
MKTTVDINDELLRIARKRAADEHVTLREVFHRALRQYLAQTPRKFKLRWKVHKVGQIQPGVILENRDVLFDLMEGHR